MKKNGAQSNAGGDELSELASIYVEITARADELTRVAARAQKDLQAVEAQADALAATGAFDEAAAKAQAIERSLLWMARRSPEAMGQVQGEVKQLTAELERLRQVSAEAKIDRKSVV